MAQRGESHLTAHVPLYQLPTSGLGKIDTGWHCGWEGKESGHLPQRLFLVTSHNSAHPSGCLQNPPPLWSLTWCCCPTGSQHWLNIRLFKETSKITNAWVHPKDWLRKLGFGDFTSLLVTPDMQLGLSITDPRPGDDSLHLHAALSLPWITFCVFTSRTSKLLELTFTYSGQ